MILTCHLLAGAALASKIQPAPLALLLAVLSHYLLDFVPHWEYSIENIKEKCWGKSFFDFLKIGADIGLGILLILFFSKNQPIIYFGAFLAILPDGLHFLHLLFPKSKILKGHSCFHRNIAHSHLDKKIPLFWGIFSQVLIIFTTIFLLL